MLTEILGGGDPRTSNTVDEMLKAIIDSGRTKSRIEEILEGVKPVSSRHAVRANAR